MDLTTDNVQQYNDINQDIFQSVRLPYTTLRLNGSFTNNIWAGDIDLYSRSELKDVGLILSKLKKVQSPNIKLYRVKVGDTEVDKLTLRNVKRLLSRSSPEKKRIKADLLIFTGYYIEEATIIYDFGEKKSGGDIRKSIEGDIREFIDEGNYLKALKRKKLLVSGQKQREIEKVLKSTDIGYPYLAYVHLDNLIKTRGLFSKQKWKKTLGNIRQDIRIKLKIKKPSMDNLVELRDYVFDVVQERVPKKYLRE